MASNAIPSILSMCPPEPDWSNSEYAARRRAMNRSHFAYHQYVLRLVVLGLIVFGSSFTSVGASQVAPVISPRLLNAVPASHPGAILVTGQDFTPGGQVYIVLHDQWGMELHETRWVSASVTTLGMNGSRDPALGYIRGGTIHETFGPSETVYGPNGSRDPALGYIPGSGDTLLTGATEAIFGPNGSRDPALGFVPGSPGREVVYRLCGTTMMARAFDAEADSWSNTVDIDPGC
jgi:hypothetical protein